MASSSSAGAGRGSSTTTSLVLEFRCLYTHDIKRKNQKRWQDARLKYHSYNKRIVVHDERGNYVGDAHWPGEHHDFGDGEEVMLERGGVMVQVADEIGKHEQNLGELVDKRAKEVEARRAAKAAKAPASRPRPTDNVQLSMIQRRPLGGGVPGQQNQSTPLRERMGRAVIPKESPYEARLRGEGAERVQPEELDTPSPAKKRKCSDSPRVEKSGHARALFGTQLTLSARPPSTPLARTLQQYQPLHDRANLKALSVGQKRDRHGEGDGSGLEREKPKTTKQTKPRSRLKRAHPSPLRELSSHGDDSDDTRTSPKQLNDGDDGATADNIQTGQGSAHILPKPPNNSKKHRPRKAQQETHVSAPTEVTGPEICKQPSVSANKLSSSTIRRPLKRRGASPPQPKSTSSDSDEEVGEDEDTPPYAARHSHHAKGQEGSHAAIRRKDRHKTGNKPHLSAEKSRSSGTLQSNTEEATNVKRNEDAVQAAEPRAELRIRPRKRRGLLMLAEKTPRAPPRPASPRLPSPDPPLPTEGDVTEEAAAAAAVPPELAEVELAEVTSSNHSFEEWLQTGVAVETQPCSPPSHDNTGNSTRAGVCIEAETSTGRRESSIGALQPSPYHTSPPHHHHRLSKAQNGRQTRRSNISDHADKSSDGHSLASLVTVSESESEINGKGGSDKEREQEEDADGVSSKSNVQHASFAGARRQTSTDSAGLHATSIQSPVIASDQPTSDETDGSDRNHTPAPDECKNTPPKGLVKDKRMANSSASAISVSSSSSANANANGGAKGLRIARMGRKSVKSKEVFGMQVPDNRCMVPIELAAATSQIEMPGQVEQNGQNQNPSEIEQHIISAKSRPVQDGSNVDAIVNQALGEAVSSHGEQGKQSSRDHGTNELTRWITNPATRGKKAASRADAAGRVPQPLVPFDAVAPRQQLAPRLQRHLQQQQQQQRDEPKATTTMSGAAPKATALLDAASPSVRERSVPLGFSKANGGAWSRHAQDLLGITRPRGCGHE